MIHEYLFKTAVTMKPYNSKNYWIQSDVIGDFYVTAESVGAALKLYQAYAEERSCINISDNALRTKNPMYMDTENGTIQTGYVITGKTEIQDGYKWKTQFVDLWIEIRTLVKTEF